jgi:hypothetical protein
MATDYGNGVSRTLTAIERQFGAVVWQAGKPPLDSELNLMAQVDWDRFQRLVRAVMPSGFFLDPTRSDVDYLFNRNWANLFAFGNPRTVQGELEGTEQQPPVWANVNGWVIPIAGSQQAHDLSNVVKLNPPPESDGRIDLVFLEAWQAVVEPNPSTVNKPAKDKIHRFGNVLYGGANLDDDIEDPNVGMETTKRLQVQYRIRVFGGGAALGAGVNLEAHPEGLGDPNVYGQGTAAAPISGYPFTNMREALGDPSLWRAGDGDAESIQALGTVDGFVYAVPICAVFRRASNVYIAIGGDPNHNGAKNRTPGSKLLSTPMDGAKVLLQASLGADLLPSEGLTADKTIAITNLVGSGFDDVNHVLSSTFMVIDGEIIGISAVDLVGGTVTIPKANGATNPATPSGRGRFGTAAIGHEAGAAISFYTSHPGGLYSDEITAKDILDLRRGVNPGDWDYHRLLNHSVAQLVRGRLRTSWKRAEQGDTEGVSIHSVAYLHNDADVVGVPPADTDQVDGPDGIRTVWSDAAVIQPDVTILLDNDPSMLGPDNYTATQFDTGVSWDVGPDFHPAGFLNVKDNSNDGDFGYTNGSVLRFHIGGEDGAKGARGTFFGSSNKDVRFVTPQEMWKTGYPIVDPANGNQHPVTIRFLNQRAHEPAPTGLSDAEAARHPGPMYPWRNSNFELPFIMLGGLLNTNLQVGSIDCDAAHLVDLGGGVYEIDTGIDFEVVSGGKPAFAYKTPGGDYREDPDLVNNPVLRGQRTLFGMLTDNGRDRTGNSSEVYVVLWGDTKSQNNNGCFKVVGLGTLDITNRPASSATKIRVVPLSVDFAGFDDTSGDNQKVSLEFRSQHHNAEDTSNFDAGAADCVIVLTDIGGLSTTLPWNKDALGDGEAYDNSTVDPSGGGRDFINGKLLVSFTLMYHSGHGGMPRVPDQLLRFAKRAGVTQTQGAYLRQSPHSLDPTFPETEDTAEIHWPSSHLQVWNRLPALGWHAPEAPNYGGNIVGHTEQDREAELLVDRGSKTVVFRPFRDREMNLHSHDYTVALGPLSLLGSYDYPDATPKDSMKLFTGDVGNEDSTQKKMGFPVPREFMPRFGRQDIPYYRMAPGEAPTRFLPGINHLFRDSTDPDETVFQIIGGEPGTAGGGHVVKPLFFRTLTGADAGMSYGDSGTMVAGVNNVPTYIARKTTPSQLNPAASAAAKRVVDALAAVNSSDLGRGLVGIQLPPYLGIARLCGVYERADFEAHNGKTFKSNRYEMEDESATNLLREDVDQQTLFILRDGAEDLTGETGDHTYIIPTNTLDLTRIAGWDPNTKTFDSYAYVVEAVVFGFAKDWINGNNLVLCRNITGGAVKRNDSDVLDLEAVRMVIPCAAGYGDHFYAAYERTVYQGDPFGTRMGNTRDKSDYEARYGRPKVSQYHHIKTAVQQFDADGNYIPQIPNARSFEVLASMDFYTTMGTGNIGGKMYPGTLIDVGYLADQGAQRLPDSATQPLWRTLPRAFTEGQKGNTNRASLRFTVLTIAGLPTAEVAIKDVAGETVTFVAVNGAPALATEFQAVVDAATTATNLAEAINDHPSLDRAMTARAIGADVLLVAVPVGAEGNAMSVEVSHPTQPVQIYFEIHASANNNRPLGAAITKAHFEGGVDRPVNAGSGDSQLLLTGMTERLPMGALAQDADFLGENPLGDDASAMRTSPSGLRPIQTILPMTDQGEEYERFLGSPGELFAMSDGTVGAIPGVAYTDDQPTGGKKFRLYRGGGSAYVLSGDNPGAPIDWVSETIPAVLQPVLKGGVLTCRAMLVRNFYEEALPGDGPVVVSDGDEIQMVLITSAKFGHPAVTAEGITFDGITSPAGYGEGYSAADRFLIPGRPMFRAHNRQVPDPSEVVLAVYPEDERGA